jgi:hypothetical protein
LLLLLVLERTSNGAGFAIAQNAKTLTILHCSQCSSFHSFLFT